MFQVLDQSSGGRYTDLNLSNDSQNQANWRLSLLLQDK